MSVSIYCCPVCKKRKSPEADHSACKTELSKMAVKHERKRRRQYTVQKYMNYLQHQGALD